LIGSSKWHMHYVHSAYHESSYIPTYILYKFEVVDKGYGINFNERETLQHYNTITSFVPYKKIIIYLHNKIFIIFPNYLLPIILTTDYLSYLLILLSPSFSNFSPP
jgi:hypothetical protein